MNKFCDIFKGMFNIKTINLSNNVKLRNKSNMISIEDIIYFNILYSKIDTTKEGIVSHINCDNNTLFRRQSYQRKSNNIDIEFYNILLNKLVNFYTNNFTNKNTVKCIAVDGTYNNHRYVEQLNMGFFDITNKIPVDLVCKGPEGKNKEIASTMQYIEDNINSLKNSILICDRAYHSYKFFRFLIEKNLDFIVRIKGELKTSLESKKDIADIRNKIRIIKLDTTINKNINYRKDKNTSEICNLEIDNKCILITNLLDNDKYSNEKLLEIYRSRWDIEVFFKFLKNNCKFQHVKEKHNTSLRKTYICELITIYITQIIEAYYKSKFDKSFIINKSNLIRGVYDKLIYELIHNTLNMEKLDKFCSTYCIQICNKKDRKFPRYSKTPFTKWYIKRYSDETKYTRIIKAINEDNIDQLNKNLKVIAKRIKTINDIANNLYIESYARK